MSSEGVERSNLNAIDTLKLNHKQKMIYSNSLWTWLPRTLFIAVTLATVSSTCQAVVILHTTYDLRSDDNTVNTGHDDTPEEIAAGYSQHFSLSNSLSEYLTVGEISAGGGCTATWIGNEGTSAWLLTAAHCGGNPATEAQTFTAWDGTAFTAPANGWTRINSPDYVADSGGEALFDIALMRLDGINISITAALGGTVSQPVLYGGTAELGEVVTWIGYGIRGTGQIGQQDGSPADNSTNPPTPARANWGGGRAAAKNIIDSVRNDDDIELNFDFDHPNDLDTPSGGFVYPDAELEGHLSSGDSGGGAFITVGGAQVLAGVVSESGDEFYVDGTGAGENALTRVSSARTFITSNFAGAQFTAVPEPSAFLFLGLGGVLMGLRRYLSMRSFAG